MVRGQWADASVRVVVASSSLSRRLVSHRSRGLPRSLHGGDATVAAQATRPRGRRWTTDDCRDCRGAGDVTTDTVRGRPSWRRRCDRDDRRRTADDADRQPAAQRLAVRDHVGLDAVELLRAARRHAKARVDLATMVRDAAMGRDGARCGDAAMRREVLVYTHDGWLRTGRRAVDLAAVMRHEVIYIHLYIYICIYLNKVSSIYP